MIRRSSVPAVCIAMLACCLCTPTPSANGAGIVINFSNFALGTTFSNASLPMTIVVNGADVALSKYNNSATANGTIVEMPTGSFKNALFLADDLRADILLPAPSADGFFYFRDDGGTNLLEINGHTLSFADPLLAGPGNVIGTFGDVWFNSYSNNSGQPEIRSVKIFGMVESLAFIGQELTIDNVILAPIPEPSTYALAAFGLAALMFMRLRKTGQAKQ